MERAIEKTSSVEELAAINDYDEFNILTGRCVIVYNNNNFILGTDDEDQNNKILEVLPKDILEKYDQKSIHFSPLLRNHDCAKQFLVLTGTPISKNSNFR